MVVLFYLLCLLIASSWAYCPPPGQLGPCAQRCPPGPACPSLPARPYPQPLPYPQGQLPYAQPHVYPGAYYQPKPVLVKETAVIKRPSTATTDSDEGDYAVTPPPRPYEESTESSSEVLARPEPVPLYSGAPREIPLTSGYATGPRELPLPPPQYPQLPYPPQQPYPMGCGNLPYPGRPVYPPQPIQPIQPQPGVYPQPQPYIPHQPYPQPLPYPARPTNDCCGRCASPCRYRNRHVRAYDAKHLNSKGIAAASDPKCSNEKLKAVMKKNMVKNLSITKRLIQKAAEEKFGGAFSVICSRDDFTYVSRSSQFCLLEHDGVVCYAFQSEQ